MNCSLYQLGNDVRPEGWNALFLYKDIGQDYDLHKKKVISILDNIDESIKHNDEKFVEQEKWTIEKKFADHILVRLTDEEYIKFKLMCDLNIHINNSKDI